MREFEGFVDIYVTAVWVAAGLNRCVGIGHAAEQVLKLNSMYRGDAISQEVYFADCNPQHFINRFLGKCYEYWRIIE